MVGPALSTVPGRTFASQCSRSGWQASARPARRRWSAAATRGRSGGSCRGGCRGRRRRSCSGASRSSVIEQRQGGDQRRGVDQAAAAGRPGPGRPWCRRRRRRRSTTNRRDDYSWCVFTKLESRCDARRVFGKSDAGAGEGRPRANGGGDRFGRSEAALRLSRRHAIEPSAQSLASNDHSFIIFTRIPRRSRKPAQLSCFDPQASELPAARLEYRRELPSDRPTFPHGDVPMPHPDEGFCSIEEALAELRTAA